MSRRAGGAVRRDAARSSPITRRGFRALPRRALGRAAGARVTAAAAFAGALAIAGAGLPSTIALPLASTPTVTTAPGSAPSLPSGLAPLDAVVVVPDPLGPSARPGQDRVDAVLAIAGPSARRLPPSATAALLAPLIGRADPLDPALLPALVDPDAATASVPGFASAVDAAAPGSTVAPGRAPAGNATAPDTPADRTTPGATATRSPSGRGARVGLALLCASVLAAAAPTLGRGRAGRQAVLLVSALGAPDALVVRLVATEAFGAALAGTACAAALTACLLWRMVPMTPALLRTVLPPLLTPLLAVPAAATVGGAIAARRGRA